ncbi:hypothetical protein IEQ34_017544 [Dendrobium chrysotoxum]|uniref:Serine-threonine/tyrosine-protein kinase catalytic domain-containing protein n=1 Tax=Dendrobium chrysotoxum TaxID=161865 RepID=A0AAV7GAN5_DENCH|nr:hypothetical protein IEQ34_017544 [Dendrobium chrysotoxum]
MWDCFLQEFQHRLPPRVLTQPDHGVGASYNGISTEMLASFGYSAPEFAMSKIFTVKSDVYSLGIMMLELMTVSCRAISEQSLVKWAIPQLHDIDALSRMVDPALNVIYLAKSLSRFADIVALCVQV